jgi:RNA polymerase sigma-70 factor (ECF subfamily)
LPDGPLSEEALCFRAGDTATLNALAARWARYLLAVARAYAADEDGARDLVQHAWVRIQERRESFDGRGSLLGWMLAVCRHECLARLRHEHARATAEAAYAGAIADEQPPGDVALGAHDRASVHAALAALPPRQRDAVILRLLDGRSTRETADVMGCAEGTVKALLHQGVTNLRSRLGGLR